MTMASDPGWPVLIAIASFYPMLATVVAHYYSLFAVMGSSTRTLVLEPLMASAFFVVAVAGFKKNLWLIVAALAGHGVFDFFHHLFIQNPGVPVWWPGFCLSFDVLAGGFLAMLLTGGFFHAASLTQFDWHTFSKC